MPYVAPKDRKELDPYIQRLANSLVPFITGNNELGNVYVRTFKEVIRGAHGEGSGLACELGRGIASVAQGYGYESAYLGELNYCMTRLIQLVPCAMVEKGVWKETLRYWLYAITVGALIKMVTDEGLNLGEQGVFEDIKDEYKRRVNPAYEAVQIVKSGDCYELAPYHTVLVKSEGVDAITGEIVKGWQEIMVDFRKEMIVG
jgi:hypothetical protein